MRELSKLHWLDITSSERICFCSFLKTFVVRAIHTLWLVSIGVMSAVLSRASDVGRDWGVEREIYTDPETGIRIQELTKAGCVSDNLYFHFSNFTADNRFLVFVSDRGGSRQLFRAEAETGHLVQLTDGPNTSAHTAFPDHMNARRVYYLRGPEVFALDIIDYTEKKVGEVPQ